MFADYHRHDVSDKIWELIKPYTIGNIGTWEETQKIQECLLTRYSGSITNRFSMERFTAGLL